MENTSINSPKLLLTSKALKEELRRLGFHHTWGQWIYNEDKSFRLSFKCFKGKALGKFSINLTTRVNNYDYQILSDRMSSIEDLSKQIFEFYEFKKNHPEVRTYIGMKALPIEKSPVEDIINYIENDAEILIPIEDFFNEDGTHITKNQYGKVVLKHLCIELREKFQSK